MSTYESLTSVSRDPAVNAGCSGAADAPRCRDCDPEQILRMLRGSVRAVPFGDFLKHYICEKAQMEETGEDIRPKELCRIIRDEFHERAVPSSFDLSDSRLKDLASDWLAGRNVSRDTVLLLGFGLGMSTEDVNSFLTEALSEPPLNAADPFEVICRYCYSGGLGYPVFERLWSMYSARDIRELRAESAGHAALHGRSPDTVTDEAGLWRYISFLPLVTGTKRQNLFARGHFDELYSDARVFIARELTEAERGTSHVKAWRSGGGTDGSLVYDYRRLEKVRDAPDACRVYAAAEVGPDDAEQALYGSAQRGSGTGPRPGGGPPLCRSFGGKRMTRQHILDILNGSAPVTRFDLLTLLFFNFSRQTDRFKTPLSRYASFAECAGAVLEDSGMGPLNRANPYEAFLLMCMLSDDPPAMYSDGFDMSPAEREK